MSPHPAIAIVPVRTPTLPPATHTNVYVVGDGDLTVFDPASPYEDEQGRLAAVLDERIDDGERVERIVLTHHHLDHVSGAIALQTHLMERHGVSVPIQAHPWTADHVAAEVAETLDDGDALACGGRTLQVHHTPGHAPGHLVFHDRDSGAMIAGDMVAGIGTILIEPGDGDLEKYLDSLAHMAELAPEALLPAHGPVLPHGVAVLGMYIAHRHQRTDQIREALDKVGRATPMQLVPHVYPQLPAVAHPLGATQITSHLHWMRDRGLARAVDGGWAR